MPSFRLPRPFYALLACAITTQSSIIVGGEPIADTQGRVRQSSRASNPPAQWYLRESPNFRVYCTTDAGEPERLARRCEQLRGHLTRVWLGATETPNWSKRCDVVVFPNLEAYLQVVGREAAQTAGSALIEADGLRVSTRRIDLRGDLGREMESALAHELTHVVLADRIDRRRIPAWADEGMAVLADTPEKQTLHLADLRQGVRSQKAFRTGELLTLQSYPHPTRMGVFYGQSCSLVNFFVQRGTPQQFVQFLEIALARGYDAGLREIYAIENVARLEQLWSQSMSSSEFESAGHLRTELWTAAVE
jgi:hypothetical protein